MSSQDVTRTKPLRADARRNRSKVLQTAREAFAIEGAAVSIDEIARRAGVGAGTVHRHFPTKESLLETVLEERIAEIVDEARVLVDEPDPAEAFFGVLRLLLRHGTRDRALSDALAARGDNCQAATFVVTGARRDLQIVLTGLLHRAQAAGSVRADLSLMELHALLSGLHLSMRTADEALVGRLLEIVTDGLRGRRAGAGQDRDPARIGTPPG
ncbi:TetR/AcrR family transcriptional regulator [Saccharothrix violaceirubra]|uniref:AcrR family transcriptional regulator n=1 Tax=Saccharothrix violaceirubra TaxID=413306 RepID=A0A7W7T3F6_9PSEU|nr:TetR/AcrR family transcriptional regulator [Saccharothrix violaceirubra]MBB4965796.1 AcrR family transcriptional regulator [Saccharothrix violaceirubra]